MDDRMHRMIAHRNTQGRRNPFLDGAIAGKPIGFGEAGLELGELVRREGRRFALRTIDRQQRGQATGGIAIEPGPNGAAIDAEEARQVGPEAGLAARNQIECMETLAFSRMALVGEQGFEVSGRTRE